MKKNNKPVHLIILKIAGFLFVAMAVVGAILAVKSFGNHESNKFMIGGIMTVLGVFIGFSCLTYGFTPEFIKMHTKTQKYIQDINKDDLTDIKTADAEIVEQAITKATKAVKKGLSEVEKLLKKQAAAEAKAAKLKAELEAMQAAETEAATV